MGRVHTILDPLESGLAFDLILLGKLGHNINVDLDSLEVGQVDKLPSCLVELRDEVVTRGVLCNYDTQSQQHQLRYSNKEAYRN